MTVPDVIRWIESGGFRYVVVWTLAPVDDIPQWGLADALLIGLAGRCVVVEVQEEVREGEEYQVHPSFADLVIFESEDTREVGAEWARTNCPSAETVVAEVGQKAIDEYMATITGD